MSPQELDLPSKPVDTFLSFTSTVSVQALAGGCQPVSAGRSSGFFVFGVTLPSPPHRSGFALTSLSARADVVHLIKARPSLAQCHGTCTSDNPPLASRWSIHHRVPGEV